jgi:integrase
MKTEQEIKSLIRECVAYLREEGYSEPRIADYQRLWRNGIEEYMNKSSLVNYNTTIGEDYLVSIPVMSDSYMRTIRRNVHVLTDFLSYGKVRKRIIQYVYHELPGEIGEVAFEFIESQAKLRRSKLTLENHQRILSYFISHLALKSVTHVYIDKNVEYVIGRNNYPKREKLPSVYNADEIKQIEEAVGQSSAVGKRDYAMLLLATRLGLRSSDIAGLTFGNLDWGQNIICLTQSKTKKVIELPLLADVGEAIINYLKYGRPVSSLQQVFLTACAPYRPVNRLIINGAVSRTIISSGVDITGRKFGPHAMRHTLASQLLLNGTSLPVISETLGHSDTQVTMNYLRIDINNLMRCSLEIPLVSEVFYEQKGGLFYE